jgi:hypothetical protein
MTMVNRDEEHLRVLSILYYVWGGLSVVGACFMGAYAVIGGTVLTAVSQSEREPAAAWAGAVVFVVMGGLFLLLAALAWLTILTGRYLAQRRRYTFCLVMAIVTCLSVPLGTVLGIFTLIVLQRPSVKQLFGQTAPMPA